MLTAVPEMTWLARRWIESTACTRPRRPPATIAPSTPSTHEPLSWDTTTPQKQPISIMPSRPMLTTPERSEKSPPSAPKVSGVAYWNAPTNRPVETIAATDGALRAPQDHEQHEADERGQADLRAACHSDAPPAPAETAPGGAGPPGRSGSRALALGARDQPAHDQLAADEQDDRALDDVRDAARELGAERARELRARRSGAPRTAAPRAPRRRRCCDRAARPRCR